MPTYRNRNTGDVITLAEVNHRLERLANWERVDAEETDPARDDAPAGTLREQLAQATVAQLRELAAERGFDVRHIGRKADLVEAIAIAIEAEGATSGEEAE